MPTKEMNTLVVGTNEYEIVDSTARSTVATKQDSLVSGTNIKTINNESILGSGNLVVGGSDYTAGDGISINTSSEGDTISNTAGMYLGDDTSPATNVIDADLLDGQPSTYYQPKLTAGTNITIDSNNVISASGSGGGGVFRATYNVTSYADIVAALQADKTIIIDNVPQNPGVQGSTDVCSIIVGAYQITEGTSYSQVRLWGNNVARTVNGAFWDFTILSTTLQWVSNCFWPDDFIAMSTLNSINTSARLPVNSTAVVNYINSLDATGVSY